MDAKMGTRSARRRWRARRGSRVAFRLAAVAWMSVLGVVHGADLARSEDDRLLVEIWKSKHRMELRRGTELLREFEVGLGLVSDGTKRLRGDQRTPVGDYYVTEKHRSQRFHRFLGISYPNIEDADRGYAAGVISPREWARVFVAIAGGTQPNQGTILGGRIGIHGFGHRPYIPGFDWTDGCLAVSNEESEYLYTTVPVGTRVRIHD